ncbi:AAA family ATPase [Hyphomonas sp.]|uniref:AAA family ATPase n=1 Tax=Hyphomonas sp. TaxID=87 RepID=UPI0030F88171
MPDFHILTGPPGSGKTTMLQHLAGTCHTVAEPARRVLAQQRRVDGQGTGDRDPALFVHLMLEQAVRAHDAALSAPGPVVFDRGLADLLAYAAYWQLDTGAIDRAIAVRGRARNVFWFPPWQAIYASDDERTLDFAGAEAFGGLTRSAYQGLGYTLIDMPLTDAATRAAFIRDIIGV